MCKTVKNKNKQNVLHMFALQHFILPKVIGCLFHLHLYLFNSQKKEMSKHKKGGIKRQKRRYQKTKKRNKQTTLFFFKCNPLISFISIYKLFYSYTSSIPNSSKPVSVLAHGSKCGGRLNVASLS